LFFLITFFFSILLKEQWTLPSLSAAWIANLLFALMFMTTGQLMIYGFKYVEAQIGSLIMLAEVVFGIIFGFIFYKEAVSITTLVGGVVIISAIILPEIRKKEND
jgi:drug/metabolite transporter (DMT)-like permease